VSFFGFYETVKDGEYDTINHNLYNGVNWLYTNVEAAYAYDYKIFYSWFSNNIYSESVDFFTLFTWFASLHTSSLQFFWAVLLDNYVNVNLAQFALTDE
jgi:hypothetical protein